MARKQKRWMKSVIEASKSEMPPMPWARKSAVAKPATPQPAKRQAG